MCQLRVSNTHTAQRQRCSRYLDMREASFHSFTSCVTSPRTEIANGAEDALGLTGAFRLTKDRAGGVQQEQERTRIPGEASPLQPPKPRHQFRPMRVIQPYGPSPLAPAWSHPTTVRFGVGGARS